jgi:hypothetical protein
MEAELHQLNTKKVKNLILQMADELDTSNELNNNCLVLIKKFLFYFHYFLSIPRMKKKNSYQAKQI